MAVKNLEIKGSDSEAVESISHTSQQESLESMARLALTAHLLKIEQVMADEAPAIYDKQDSVRLYNQIQQKIDRATEPNGELSVQSFTTSISDLRTQITTQYNEDLKKSPESADSLKAQYERRMAILDEIGSLGSDMAKNGSKFSTEQRVRLMENLKNEIADLNLQINLDIQKSKKYYEHYNHAYEFAMGIARTADQTNKTIIRNIAVR